MDQAVTPLTAHGVTALPAARRGRSSIRSGSICGSGLLLFVFSAFSYMVDYFQLQGMLRWTLILIFMLLKAGFIVAIFMHMAWERLALKLAILVPPLALLVLIGLMAIEGDYTFLTRLQSFVQQEQKPGGHHGGHAAEQPAAEHP